MNIVLSTGTHLLFGKLYLRQIYKIAGLNIRKHEDHFNCRFM